MRRLHPDASFIGPYEKNKAYGSLPVEQWLYANRERIRGTVLDMSTPRALHEWIYQLPSVGKVLISDLHPGEVEKMGFRSPVDIAGDFCAEELPVPPESFDTILCISILEHCENPLAMVKNFQRLLRLQGVVFILCPYVAIDGHMDPDYWRFGRDAYLLMARKAGLRVVQTGQIGDMGKYLLYEIGENAKAKSWHRGIPLSNWMIAQKVDSLDR
ncbi:MAG: methyltransferase domain-containing protein [Candidatus Omnitrophota bacterium]